MCAREKCIFGWRKAWSLGSCVTLQICTCMRQISQGLPHGVTRRDSQTTRAIGGETIKEVSLDELALPQAVVLSRRSPPLLPVMLRCRLRDATQSREPGTAADASLSEWIAARANVA